jgi:hypothetical protein
VSAIYRGGLASLIVIICLGLAAVPAAGAKEFPYTLDPELSLTGDCFTSSIDSVADPDCPYPLPPGGPSARFSNPKSVAVDAYGDLYVASWGTDGKDGRIDIFDDEGHFITEFADPNGPESIAVDSKGYLYAFERFEGGEREVARYAPKKYEPEAGKIEYSQATRVVIDSEPGRITVTVDPSNDHLYATKNIKLWEYSSAEAGNTLLHEITPAGLHFTDMATVDGQRRRIYTVTCTAAGSACKVLVLEADPPYNILKEITGPPGGGLFVSPIGALALAVDEESGDFFVGDIATGTTVYEFDENYAFKAKFDIKENQNALLQAAVSNSPKNPGAKNRHYLFLPLRLSGNALAYEPPNVKEPTVNDLGAVNISETGAEAKVTIDPHQADTEWVLEYVSEAQFNTTGFAEATVLASGTIPGPSGVQHFSALLSGLDPETTYYLRAFAENEVGSDEEESLFATYADAPIFGQGQPPCPNEALRFGPSASLPDCRAWELVTPPDTGGGPTLGSGAEGDRFGAVQASPDGGAVSFELQNGAIPGIKASSGFHGDPYASTRGSSGWSTHLAGPTGEEASKPQPGSFSPDQGYDFWLADGTGSKLVEGDTTHYVRYPDGHSELVGRGSLATDVGALGRLITEGGTHIVFETGSVGFPPVQLEPNAPADGIKAIYDRTADEVTHVVSLLPGDVTPASNSTYLGASPEGEGIAFENEAKLYLRLHNTTTYEIGAGATYAGLSQGGARIFYLRGGDLHAFDVATEAEIDFTEVGDAVPVNVAPQGTRAYFVSEEEIPGSGPNPQGDEAQGGSQNLYLSEEGDVSFLATLTERDVQGEVLGGIGHLDGLGNWTEALKKRTPATDPSRLNPSGSVFLFQSRADLTGYEESEFPQVYRYDASANRLHCLSCPPTKAPSIGGGALHSIFGDSPFRIYGFVPGLDPSGDRVFFESTDALVSGDTDGLRDVYEWEEEGIGSCKREGGCIYLISSGHSSGPDFLFGHSLSGDDVFIFTADVLVPGDEAIASVYDARVGGGFAQTLPSICPLSDPCQEHTTAPSFPTPASESTARSPDSGNVTPTKPKRCPKGKHKVKRGGKVRCVKNKHHKRHRVRANGRAAK